MRLGSWIGVVCALATASHAERDDDNHVLACQPTLACTADLAPPGTVEIELGYQPRDQSGGPTVHQLPFLLKLPLASWIEVQLASNGYTYISADARYFDNVVTGAKFHLADQTSQRPSLAVTTTFAIPSPPQRGYTRAYDLGITGHASKDLGRLHLDLVAGLELYQVDGPRAYQPFTALAATYAATKKWSFAVEPHLFARAAPFAARDAGVMVAAEYAVHDWLVLDAAIDVIRGDEDAVMGLFGVSIAPVRLGGH